MKRVVAWVGLVVTGLMGAAACFALLYLFASIAPAFWLLILLAIVIGAAIAGGLAR